MFLGLVGFQIWIMHFPGSFLDIISFLVFAKN